GFRLSHSLPGAMTTWTLLKIARAINDAGPAIYAHLRPIRKRGLVDVEHDRRFRSGLHPLVQPDARSGYNLRNIAIVTSRVDIFFNLPLSVIDIRHACTARSLTLN